MQSDKKKNKRYCLAKGCINSDKKMPNLSFFSLPKDAERRRKWLISLGREDMLSKKELKIKSYVVCSTHFDESVVKITKQLKNDAIPTIFLPDKSQKSTCLRISDVRTLKDKTASNEAQKDDAMKRKLEEEHISSESKRQRVYGEVQKVTKERTTQNTSNKSNHAENIDCRFRKLIEWQNKTKNGIKENQFNKEFKEFALNLHYSSPDAYRCLQTLLKLPSENTLKKIKLKVPGELNGRVLKSLSLKLKSLPKKAQFCTVCIGKLALQPNLCYDIKTDEVIGFHNINGKILPKLASNAFVIMVQGIYCKWTQPIAYSLLASSEDYEEFDLWLNDSIAKLFEIGAKVKAIVTKQNSYFEKYAKDIKKVTSDKPYFFIGKNKVYYIFDVPHSLKCTRNDLLSTNFNYNGNVLSWDYIQTLYEDQKEKNLKLIPKLSDAHMQPNILRRMEVKYAAQVFSNAVYAALETYIDFDKIPTEARATAKFVKAMNDIFDVLNSSKVDSIQKAFKMTARQKEILSVAEIMFSNMKSINRNTGKVNPDHIKTLLNFQIAIHSIQQLFQDLKNEGFKYLFTRRLNQDSLENFFISVRQQSESCTELTPVRFTRAFSKLFLHNMLRSPPSLRCKTDIHKILLKAEKLINITADKEDKNKSLILLSGESDYRMELPQENTLVYVASFLVFKCSKIHNCEEMTEVLASLKPFDDTQLFPHFREFNKNAEFYGKLKMPPEALIQYVEELEAIFKDCFVKCIQDRPGSTMFESMRKILPILLCSCFPIDYFLKLFLRLRIFETMKLNNLSLRKSKNPMEVYIKLA